jgi:signal recognition particle subunit SEC65
MPRYKFTQESGTDFKVVDPDKADAQEDANEIRQILDDLGNLLKHSKRDDSYPKDGTTGGTIIIDGGSF